jgi:hypothetical protein
MRTLALLVALSPALAYAQEPAAPPAATPAAAEPTVEQTASPELVGELVKETGVTPKQAQGAAGALFGVAKTKLSVADFAKVAGVVPGMDGLLKAGAPTDPKLSAVAALAGSAGGNIGSMAAAVAAMNKMGLKPETIAKMAPALIKVVQSKGGAEVASLLAGALK